jgi:hypothetical protein
VLREIQGIRTRWLRVIVALALLIGTSPASVAEVRNTQYSAAEPQSGHPNHFEFVVDVPERAIQRAVLKYRSTSGSTWLQTRRSINGRTPLGGYLYNGLQPSTQISEELNPLDIIKGINYVDFLNGEFGRPPQITDPQLVLWVKSSDAAGISRIVVPARNNLLKKASLTDIASQLIPKEASKNFPPKISQHAVQLISAIPYLENTSGTGF